MSNCPKNFVRGPSFTLLKHVSHHKNHYRHLSALNQFSSLQNTLVLKQ